MEKPGIDNSGGTVYNRQVKKVALRCLRGVIFYCAKNPAGRVQAAWQQGVASMAEKESMKGRPVISADGLAKLEEELNYYKLIKRKEIAEQIKVARGFGDLSENAEYDEAKNEQAKIEDHITQLETMLRTAVVVDHAELTNDQVGVGSRVRVRDTASGFEMEYKVVGATEADPLSGKISNESPVGGALIGAKPGEEVTFAVPDGLRTLKVLEIMKD